ncbi:MAG TPA: FAD-dependent oxidoreductase [Solirubrobacterales bacterium]
MAHETPARTVIAGGGIAALEAALALADLAGARTELTLISPEPEFSYRPMTVEEPFSHQPAETRELAPFMDGLGGRFVRAALESVDVGGHQVALAGGDRLDYEHLIVCVGARAVGALQNAQTFRVVGEPLAIDAVIDTALGDASELLAFIVPQGATWSLPIYELAMMTRRRAEETGRERLRIAVVTPESVPLALFGTIPSQAVADLLESRAIEFVGDSRAADEGDGIVLAPGNRPLEAGAAVALPAIEGWRIRGLPQDESGFIPIDDHARVVGAEDVYAAGDGTNFPIKHGGLGTQQADAAASAIAARLGAEVEPEPFHPVLRGQLIVGAESLNLRHDITGGHGEGTVSLDYLWWPPHKVSGKYLAPFLAGAAFHGEPVPPAEPLDLELAMPREWHSEPMALDPYGPIDGS